MLSKERIEYGKRGCTLIFERNTKNADDILDRLGLLYEEWYTAKMSLIDKGFFESYYTCHRLTDEGIKEADAILMGQPHR